MGVPVLLSFLFRRFYLGKGKHFFPETSAPGDRSGRRTDFSLLDICMMNSFESIVKVGGYLILFSVILSLLSESGQHGPLFTALAATLEVTNGILIIDGLGYASDSILAADYGADFFRRILLCGADTMHDPGYRTENLPLCHTKTGCRGGSQSSGSFLCELFTDIFLKVFIP